MRTSLSRFLAPVAMLPLAFGLCFGHLAPPAAADATWPSPPKPEASVHASEPTATLAELKARLDRMDQFAVLEAIHVGLTDAPDGSTYMWRRHNGKIAGSVRPTASFRDQQGKVCRFLVFQLMLGEHLRQVEGIACRQDDRSWLLEG